MIINYLSHLGGIKQYSDTANPIRWAKTEKTGNANLLGR